MNKPLADLLRPNTLDDMIGQTHLLSEGSLFRRVIENKKVPNMIFYGPPGIGKTTAANIIASQTKRKLYKLNGTTASTEDIKLIINEITSVFADEEGILLYLDEIQYLNKKQQQTLLEFIENGNITLIASTTENPYFYIYPALISRCTVFEFKSIEAKEISLGLDKVAKKLKIKFEDEAKDLLAISCNGDMRKAINNLEFILNSKSKDSVITLKDVNDLINRAHIAYDRAEDKHYDNLSALMKSLRGSDPDAAIFYLAKMLEAGDLKAAARRLLCSASEDVGLAYPQIIPIVKSCVDTALQLGLPEARLPLANAAILIATAPKSNSSYLAMDAAIYDIQQGKGINVPRQLQNTHFDGEDNQHKGQHYQYPHDYKNHWVKQQYLPDDIKDAKYYRYQDNKIEQTMKEYWDKVKK